MLRKIKRKGPKAQRAQRDLTLRISLHVRSLCALCAFGPLRLIFPILRTLITPL